MALDGSVRAIVGGRRRGRLVTARHGGRALGGQRNRRSCTGGRLYVQRVRGCGPTDKAQLVSWIASRTGRTVSVPDLTASGYAFMGGRLVATPHGAAGLLMYSNGQGQRLAMLVRPMAIDRDTRMSEHSYGDINGVTWASKGTGFSLVGPAPADLLHPIADEVRRQE